MKRRYTGQANSTKEFKLTDIVRLINNTWSSEGYQVEVDVFIGTAKAANDALDILRKEWAASGLHLSDFPGTYYTQPVTVHQEMPELALYRTSAEFKLKHVQIKDGAIAFELEEAQNTVLYDIQATQTLSASELSWAEDEIRAGKRPLATAEQIRNFMAGKPLTHNAYSTTAEQSKLKASQFAHYATEKILKSIRTNWAVPVHEFPAWFDKLRADLIKEDEAIEAARQAEQAAIKKREQTLRNPGIRWVGDTRPMAEIAKDQLASKNSDTV